MNTQVRLASVAALIGCAAIAGNAQSVVSAHSGTLHYFDGSVAIDGQSVQSKVGKFSEIKENSVLRTGQGRAEILLTPGVFLRVGENTEIRMLDNRLLSTRVEVLSGNAVVESDDPEMSTKNPAVTIIYKDFEIQPVKYAILEVAAEAGQLKVYKGQASVSSGATHITVKEGKLMPFTAGLLTEKFDEKQADDLYLWARDRSAYLSAANMSSARSLAASGYSMNGLTSGGYTGLGYNSRFNGGWYYNSFLSMYTYMPYGGTAWSPFGYGYFSPYTIYSYYSPGNYYWYGGGSRAGSGGVPLSNIGTSSLAAQQVSRIGAGTNTHPTLSSPVRGAGGFSGTNAAASGGTRGGFADFGARGGGNPGFNGGNSGGFNSAGAIGPSGGGGGGFSSAGARGGGGGGSVGGGGAAGGASVGGGSRGK